MRYPHPPSSGEKITIYNYLKALSGLGYLIDLIAISDEKQISADQEQLKREITGLNNIHIIKIPRLTGFLSALLSGLHFKPLQVGYFSNYYTRKKVSEIIREQQYDKILIHTVRLTGLLPIDPDKTIILFSDSISRNYHLSRSYLSFPIREIQILESHLLKKYEKEISGKSLTSIFHNQLDIDFLEIFHKRIKIIPVSKEVIPQFIPITPETKKRILLIGQYSYYPNRDALKFLQENMKLIEKKKIPIDIIGTGISRSQKRNLCRSEYIRYLGYADSLEKEILNSYGVVCPIRFGAGMQNKILDAIVNGRPSISTTFSKEPYKIEMKKQNIKADCLLATSNNNDFFNYIENLLDDREYANSIAEETFKTAGVFDISNISKTLSEIL